MQINRTEISRAISKAIAYKQCGKDAEASIWAAHVIVLLQCHDIIRPNFKFTLDGIRADIEKSIAS